MKVTAVLFFFVSLALSAALPGLALAFPFVLAVAFALYGLGRSASLHLNLLNDLPNALRVLFATLGGYLMTLDRVFIFPSVGLLLLLVSVYLNDEFQRRALRSIRDGRRGGSVALLGIDGSGKSTHSAATSRWLEERGYRVELVPFHAYLFVEKLSALSSSVRGSPRASGRNPLRPVLSLLDNLLLQMSSSLGCRVEGTVVIYDRFIWSTYIKYEALGYPVKPLSRFYLAPTPTSGVVLDVPVEKSLRVIDERESHIRYPGSVLQLERDRYLEIARKRGYPIIDATGSFDRVQQNIENHLASLFPRVPGATPP